MKEQLEKEIQMYVAENNNGEVSPPILWDACKAVMRGKLIAISTQSKKAKQKKITRLQGELEQLEREHSVSQDSRIYQQIREKRNEINEIHTQEIQKKLVFLKQKCYETGSKSTKLLAYRLRKQQVENGIYQIRDPQPRMIYHKTKDIQGCFEKHYKTL